MNINIEKALRFYYEKIELSTKDIEELFGVKETTATRKKKQARAKMVEQDIPSMSPANVNTYAAYEAWGLDIGDVERRYRKLQKIFKN